MHIATSFFMEMRHPIRPPDNAEPTGLHCNEDPREITSACKNPPAFCGERICCSFESGRSPIDRRVRPQYFPAGSQRFEPSVRSGVRFKPSVYRFAQQDAHIVPVELAVTRHVHSVNQDVFGKMGQCDVPLNVQPGTQMFRQGMKCDEDRVIA